MSERTDERMGALLQGSERLRDDLYDARERLSALEHRCHQIWGDDYSGLRRLIREEIRVAKEKQGVTGRELIALILSGLALLAAVWDRLGG